MMLSIDSFPTKRLLLAAALLLAWVSLFTLARLTSATAQITMPVETPTQSPLPTATPQPSPTPSDEPAFSTSPGVPDEAVENAYVSARTPQANVVVATVVGSTNVAVNKALAGGRTDATAQAASVIRPLAVGGVFTQICLASAATASKAPVTQSSNAAISSVPLAVVTLSYGSAWAGKPVLVKPLTEGVVSTTGADGNLYSATSQGLLLTVDSAGMLTFGFQAPNASKTYQVLTRLDNVASTFTFTVQGSGL